MVPLETLFIVSYSTNYPTKIERNKELIGKIVIIYKNKNKTTERKIMINNTIIKLDIQNETQFSRTDNNLDQPLQKKNSDKSTENSKVFFSPWFFFQSGWG